MIFTCSSRCEEITLGWDPSTDTSVVGYKLYYGLEGNEPTIISVTTNQVTISDLQKAKSYFFYVTAFNGDGLESAPSETINYTVPLAAEDSPLLIAERPESGEMILRALGAVWQEYTVEFATDAANPNWTGMFTVMSDDYGWIEIYLPTDQRIQLFRLVARP